MFPTDADAGVDEEGDLYKGYPLHLWFVVFIYFSSILKREPKIIILFVSTFS